MSRFPRPYANAYGRQQTLEYSRDASVVATFMNTVYAWMCVGLATTGVVAWWISTQPQFFGMIFNPMTMIILILVQLALVWVVANATESLSAPVATALFVLYSALNGLTLSAIFLIYSLGSITATFAVCAGMFAAMSIVGFVTRKDLSSLGGFLFMALIGLILASVVNIFMQSSTLDWIISYAGVFIFLGLTVYDTNKLKEIAYATEGDEKAAARLAITGSLILYLDFINLFLFLLRILGKARE